MKRAKAEILSSKYVKKWFACTIATLLSIETNKDGIDLLAWVDTGYELKIIPADGFWYPFL